MRTPQELSPAEAVNLLLHLQREEQTAHHNYMRPGVRLSTAENQRRMEAWREARNRTERFVDTLLPGQGDRLARLVEAENSELLSKVTF